MFLSPKPLLQPFPSVMGHYSNKSYLHYLHITNAGLTMLGSLCGINDAGVNWCCE